MRAFFAAVLASALAGGCQSGNKQDPPAVKPAPGNPGDRPPAPAPAQAPAKDDKAYARDIDRICRVEELAMAGAEKGVNPMLVTAQWLDANLETPTARELLIRINQLPEDQRAAAYDAEAKKAGVAACPTARRWDRVTE